MKSKPCSSFAVEQEKEMKKQAKERKNERRRRSGIITCFFLPLSCSAFFPAAAALTKWKADPSEWNAISLISRSDRHSITLLKESSPWVEFFFFSLCLLYSRSIFDSVTLASHSAWWLWWQANGNNLCHQSVISRGEVKLYTQIYTRRWRRGKK